MKRRARPYARESSRRESEIPHVHPSKHAGWDSKARLFEHPLAEVCADCLQAEARHEFNISPRSAAHIQNPSPGTQYLGELTNRRLHDFVVEPFVCVFWGTLIVGQNCRMQVFQPVLGRARKTCCSRWHHRRWPNRSVSHSGGDRFTQHVCTAVRVSHSELKVGNGGGARLLESGRQTLNPKRSQPP